MKQTKSEFFSGIISLLRLLKNNYRAIAVHGLSALLVALTTFFLSGLVVFPLWLAATQARKIYTVVVIGIAGCVLVAAMVIGLIKKRRRFPSTKAYIFASIIPKVKVLALLLILLSGLYGTVYCYVHRTLPLAIGLSVGMIVYIGFLPYGLKQRKKESLP